MDRVGVFVDAGYLFAAASEALLGTKRPRGALSLDHNAVVKALTDFACTVSGLPLLRIYWYDGTSGAPSSQHLTLAYCNHVKIRLGFVNASGEQKGVDSLIITDMIALARNRAMADAILLSGDEDLRVGVQQAQEWGVRVHLLGVDTGTHNQSALLKQEADATYTWGKADIEKFLQPAVMQPIRIAPSGQTGHTTMNALESVARAVVATLDESDVAAIAALAAPARTVPRNIDRQLLSAARQALQSMLEPAHKKEVRRHFFAEIVARHQSAACS